MIIKKTIYRHLKPNRLQKSNLTLVRENCFYDIFTIWVTSHSTVLNTKSTK